MFKPKGDASTLSDYRTFNYQMIVLQQMMKGLKSAVDCVLGGWEKEVNGRKRRSGKSEVCSRGIFSGDRNKEQPSYSQVPQVSQLPNSS